MAVQDDDEDLEATLLRELEDVADAGSSTQTSEYGEESCRLKPPSPLEGVACELQQSQPPSGTIADTWTKYVQALHDSENYAVEINRNAHFDGERASPNAHQLGGTGEAASPRSPTLSRHTLRGRNAVAASVLRSVQTSASPGEPPAAIPLQQAATSPSTALSRAPVELTEHTQGVAAIEADAASALQPWPPGMAPTRPASPLRLGASAGTHRASSPRGNGEPQLPPDDARSWHALDGDADTAAAAAAAEKSQVHPHSGRPAISPMRVVSAMGLGSLLESKLAHHAALSRPPSSHAAALRMITPDPLLDALAGVAHSEDYLEEARRLLELERGHLQSEMRHRRQVAEEEDARFEAEMRQARLEAQQERMQREAAAQRILEAQTARRREAAAVRIQAVQRGHATRSREQVPARIAAGKAVRAHREQERVAEVARLQEEQRRIEADAARELEESRAPEERREAAERAAAEAVRQEQQLAHQRRLAEEMEAARRLQVAREQRAVETRQQLLTQARMAVEDERAGQLREADRKRALEATRLQLERECQQRERACMEMEGVMAASTERSLRAMLAAQAEAAGRERRSMASEDMSGHFARQVDALLALQRQRDEEHSRQLSALARLQRDDDAARASGSSAITAAPLLSSLPGDLSEFAVGSARSALRNSSRGSDSGVPKPVKKRSAASDTAVRVQTLWRGYRVRRSSSNPLLQQRVRQYWAACRVQALWRGYRVRAAIFAALEGAKFEDGDTFDYAGVDLDDFLPAMPLEDGASSLSTAGMAPSSSTVTSSSLPLVKPMPPQQRDASHIPAGALHFTPTIADERARGGGGFPAQLPPPSHPSSAFMQPQQQHMYWPYQVPPNPYGMHYEGYPGPHTLPPPGAAYPYNMYQQQAQYPYPGPPLGAMIPQGAYLMPGGYMPPGMSPMGYPPLPYGYPPSGGMPPPGSAGGYEYTSSNGTLGVSELVPTPQYRRAAPGDLLGLGSRETPRPATNDSTTWELSSVRTHEHDVSTSPLASPPSSAASYSYQLPPRDPFPRPTPSGSAGATSTGGSSTGSSSGGARTGVPSAFAPPPSASAPLDAADNAWGIRDPKTVELMMRRKRRLTGMGEGGDGGGGGSAPTAAAVGYSSNTINHGGGGITPHPHRGGGGSHPKPPIASRDAAYLYQRDFGKPHTVHVQDDLPGGPESPARGGGGGGRNGRVGYPQPPPRPSLAELAALSGHYHPRTLDSGGGSAGGPGGVRALPHPPNTQRAAAVASAAAKKLRLLRQAMDAGVPMTLHALSSPPKRTAASGGASGVSPGRTRDVRSPLRAVEQRAPPPKEVHNDGHGSLGASFFLPSGGGGSGGLAATGSGWGVSGGGNASMGLPPILGLRLR